MKRGAHQQHVMNMYLIQIFLPLYDNNKRRIPRTRFTQVADELTAKYGGLSMYSRAPLVGLWSPSHRRTQRDDLVIYEVMSRTLNRRWWRHYRQKLEQLFKQQQVIIRAQRYIQL